MISPGYYRAIGTRLLRGREFTEADRKETERVVIVNQAFADRYWPGQDPLGKHVGAIDAAVGRRGRGRDGEVSQPARRSDARGGRAVQQMYWIADHRCENVARA